MAETTTVLHGQYKYKENDVYKTYITLYPENDTDDVKVGSFIVDIVVKKKNNKETTAGNLKTFNSLVTELINRLNNRSPITLYNIASELKASDPIIEKNRIVVESDTGGIKIGDGKTKYKSLKYIGSEYEDHNVDILINNTKINDLQMVLTNKNNTTLEQRGLTAVETVLPDTFTRPLIYFEIENLV